MDDGSGKHTQTAFLIYPDSTVTNLERASIVDCSANLERASIVDFSVSTQPAYLFSHPMACKSAIECDLHYVRDLSSSKLEL